MSKFARIGLFVVLSLVVMATSSSAAEELFTLQMLTRSSNEAAVEAWRVNVDPTPLERGAESLVFDLFDGQRHVVTRTEVERRGRGDLVWRGELEDGGQAVLTLKHGHVVGALFTDHGTYELITSPEGQIFQKLDPWAAPPCANEGHVHEHKPARSVFGLGTRPVVDTEPTVAARNRTNIDVMIMYTVDALLGAGGTSAIEATAQSAVDMANTAFVNSGTVAFFTLVHTAGVIHYNDSGDLVADRNWVTNDATVALLRDAYKADLVGLLVEDGGGYCGVAHLMNGDDDPSTFGDYGFQVTARSCAVGNLSYAHEHGHNMGLWHDRGVLGSNPNTIYDWSHGHVVDGKYRTVMAYPSTCTSGCSRGPYFSNPGVIHQNVATGVVNEADNAWTIDLIAGYTANYRSCSGNNSLNFGTATVQDSYSTTSLSGVCLPRVVMGPASHNGGDPGTLRLRNVGLGSFQHTFQEWDYLNGSHGNETAGWLAVPDGASSLGSLDVESGSIYIDDHGSTIVFSRSFSSPPVVIASVTTENESSAVTTRIHSVVNGGFRIELQEQESAGAHSEEVVHWIAIERGTTTVNGKTLIVGRTGTEVDEDWFTINFGQSVSNLTFLAAMQTMNGADPATLRYKSLSGSSVKVRVHEEKSEDNETGHNNEVVGYIVIGD
ncbi:MAG: zinc-dependent metalloprotease family protein [Acidobacteriota bacterium]